MVLQCCTVPIGFWDTLVKHRCHALPALQTTYLPVAVYDTDCIEHRRRLDDPWDHGRQTGPKAEIMRVVGVVGKW